MKKISCLRCFCLDCGDPSRMFRAWLADVSVFLTVRNCEILDVDEI